MSNVIVVKSKTSTWEAILIAAIATAVSMFTYQMRIDKEYEAAKRKCELENRATCHLVWQAMK